MVYSDPALGYALPWKAKLLAGADNVFDRKPRIDDDAGTSFVNGTSAWSSVDPQMPIDRLFYVHYNRSFQNFSCCTNVTVKRIGLFPCTNVVHSIRKRMLQPIQRSVGGFRAKPILFT